MRRSVFFAVCLSLVLSLLKEAPAETPADTTSSITTENGADNEIDPDLPAEKALEASGSNNGTDPKPPEVPPTKPSGSNNGTEPKPPEVPPTEPSGSNNGTDPKPPEVPPTEPSGSNNGTDPKPPEVPPTKPSGSNNGTDPKPPEVPPTKPSGSNNGTDPKPPEVPPTEPSGSNNGTDPKPPEVPPTKPSGSNNGTDPKPPEVPPTKPSGSNNGTDPKPPEVPPTEPSGSNNGTDPKPPEVPPTEPSGNNTDNGTDPKPPEVPPTEPSGSNNGTDPKPPVVQPTKPSGNNTDNGTDPKPPEVPPTKPSDNSTVNGTEPNATETPTSAPTADFCLGDPCGRSSATCVSLHSNYTCVCEYGLYYRDENCYKGEVYPATIAVNITYSDNLQIVNSTEYQELFKNVSAFFKDAFTNLTGYVQTVIKKIQPLKQSENRYSAPGLNITVTNLFTENSNESATTVRAAVTAAINSNRFFVSSYEVTGHCEVYECDLKTTVCEEKQFFPECKCKPDLEKTKWNDRSCPICSASCSAARHKYCVQEEEGPTCKCMINFKKEAGECVACPVGYSGEECTDNSELILIIVGTVFGAIILCLVIAVSVISVRAKHKQNPEKRSLIRSGYSDTNTPDDRPSMFPRVQTTSGHANPGYQPNNPYEMRSRNRDHYPERDYDDLYEISREPRGFRTQSRY